MPLSAACCDGSGLAHSRVRAFAPLLGADDRKQPTSRHDVEQTVAHAPQQRRDFTRATIVQLLVTSPKAQLEEVIVCAIHEKFRDSRRALNIFAAGVIPIRSSGYVGRYQGR